MASLDATSWVPGQLFSALLGTKIAAWSAPLIRDWWSWCVLSPAPRVQTLVQAARQQDAVYHLSPNDRHWGQEWDTFRRTAFSPYVGVR
jgi:hypothetical protein